MIPKLRFREYSYQLSSFLLGDLAEVTTGNKDTQNKVDDGIYPFFVRSQNIAKINSYSLDCEAILTSGDGVGVGKDYHYINGKFDFHQRVYCIYNFKDNVSGNYLFYYFSAHFNKRVMRLSAKNSVDSVRRDMITEMPIVLPNLSEQTKIADFLSSVSDKITLLNKQYNLLCQYRKSIMQKIFSQELHFKYNNKHYPEWIKVRLGDYLISYNHRVSSDTEIPIYTSSRTGLKPQADYFDNRELLNEGEYGVVPDGYATYRHMSDDSTFKFNKNTTGNDIAVSKEYPVFKTSNMDLDFLLLLLNESGEFRKFAREQKSGGTRVRLYFKKLCEWNNASYPHPDEQTKIANFLCAIDEKITAKKVELEKLKTWKQGLLQQMFV